MKCSDLTDLISAYDDNELPETQRQYIESHLAGCADCRRQLDEFRAARRKITSLYIPAVPDIKAGVTARTAGRSVLSGVAWPRCRCWSRCWCPASW
jgi:anti-sigma factor RsiW